MSEELIAFLISVSAILALALFVPFIESIVRFFRRNSEQPEVFAVTEAESKDGFLGTV